MESQSIHRTIGQNRVTNKQKLWIGSVKPNIGHLEAAAGVASIIKGVLAMEKGLIPPNLYFNKLNPAIPLDDWNMVVPTALTPWPACQKKRMSLSGFGMGGTNAHLVLEEWKKTNNISINGYSTSQAGKKRLFVLSSHDQAGFKRLGDSLIEHLDQLGPVASKEVFLANLAYTLAIARSSFSWKTSCFAGSTTELRESLTTLGSNATRASRIEPPRIGFVFTGQGAQWAGMGIEMLERRTFSLSVAKSATLLKAMGCDWDPVTELSKPPKSSRLDIPEISQPICTVLQIAFVDELKSWGISPSKVVGHSSGEIAAAYSVGALSHRDALAAAYFRGKAAASLKTHKDGTAAVGMMAAGCSREEAEDLIAGLGVQVTVACVNSPSSITLSGDTISLEALRLVLDERGVFARRLKVDVAYHSSFMHPCSAEYAASIADLECG